MKPLLLATLEFPPMHGGIARELGVLSDELGEELVVISDPQAFLSTNGSLRWKKAVRLFLGVGKNVRGILVSHVLPLGTAAMLAKRFTGVPYIVFVHGLDLSFAKRTPLKRFMAKQVLRSAATVVVNSEALGKEVQKDFGVKKTILAYPPLLPEFFHLAASFEQPARMPFTLLTVSRLVARKGHVRVLRALANIQDRLPSDWCYRILGDGPEYAKIKQEIEALGLTTRVSLEGSVDDETLTEAYKEASVFVMPTIAGGDDREGFGMVYVEAGAYGVPSIATLQPGVDEAVWNEKSGLLVPDGDIEALESAIIRLGDDPELRRRLGAGARERAQELLPEKTFADLRLFLNAL